MLGGEATTSPAVSGARWAAKRHGADDATDSLRTVAHEARYALLADGPDEGEVVQIVPGQTEFTRTARRDFEHGHTLVVDHYRYRGPTGDDPDTVVFEFEREETRTSTDL